MRLKFICLAAFIAFIGMPVFAGGSMAATNQTVTGGTNSPKTVAVTNRVATNNVAKTGTNVVKVVEAPGDKYTNSVEMELVQVSGGHWAGKYEVTQKEFQDVMGWNPSAFAGPKKPVDSVSWNDAMEFCKKLTEKDIKEEFLPKGYGYSLPTEDEWQRLAAGTSLADAVTSQGSPQSGTSMVGTKKPNGAGLFDMRGNVSEWVMGDTNKPFRVALGGSWQDWIEINLRPEFRLYPRPDETKNTIGFRVVLVKR